MANSTCDKLVKEGVHWNRYSWNGGRQIPSPPEFPKSSRIKKPRQPKPPPPEKISCPLAGCGKGNSWLENDKLRIKHCKSKIHHIKHAAYIDKPRGLGEEVLDLTLWAPQGLPHDPSAPHKRKGGSKKNTTPTPPPPPTPPCAVPAVAIGRKEKENADTSSSHRSPSQTGNQPIIPRDPLVYRSPVRPGTLGSPSKDPMAALLQSMMPGPFKPTEPKEGTRPFQHSSTSTTKRARDDDDELPTLKIKMRKTSSVQDREDDVEPAFIEAQLAEENLFGDDDLFGEGGDKPASFADLVASPIGTRVSVFSDDEDALAVGTQDTASLVIDRVVNKTVETAAARESDYFAELFGCEDTDQDDDGVTPQSDYLAAALLEGEDQDEQDEQAEEEQEAKFQSDFLAAAMVDGTDAVQGQDADNAAVFETGPYLTYEDACASDDEDGSGNGDGNSEADKVHYVDERQDTVYQHQELDAFDDVSDSDSDSSDDDD